MAHDDPRFPGKELVLLTLSKGVIVSRLNDEKLHLLSGRYIVILPGKHTAYINYHLMNTRSNSEKKIDFEVKPNQTAFICANRNENDWNPNVRIVDGLFPLLENTSPPCE
ncbi:hypothetical protein [Leptospira brenneri]|uniref:hypothetical protein n=1 Tax=Leptospira brenneri TaxID=2023182 RepID=UPI000C2AF636|nr:hypothetical protein [Leptospira brenneri]PJZ43710.1 hypothetical protein CH361_18865 [Leptospira brenneri]